MSQYVSQKVKLFLMKYMVVIFILKSLFLTNYFF